MNTTAGLTLHLKSQKKCPVHGVHLMVQGMMGDNILSGFWRKSLKLCLGSAGNGQMASFFVHNLSCHRDPVSHLLAM